MWPPHYISCTTQAGVAGALRNLSVTEANRKKIIANGGMESLVLASQAPPIAPHAH